MNTVTKDELARELAKRDEIIANLDDALARETTRGLAWEAVLSVLARRAGLTPEDVEAAITSQSVRASSHLKGHPAAVRKAREIVAIMVNAASRSESGRP